MPVPFGAYHRIKTFPSGKRVRLTFLNGRVIETKAVGSGKRTGAKSKTGKSLRRARRRIGR